MEQLVNDMQRALNDSGRVMTDGGRVAVQEGGDVTGGPGTQVSDTLIIESVDAPGAAQPGDNFNINVSVTCDASAPLADCEAAVRVEGAGQSEREPSSGVRELNGGQTDTFTLSPFEMGEQDIIFTVSAIEKGPLGNFNVEDQEKVTVKSQTSEEMARNSLIRAAPWAGGGALVGAGFGASSDRDPSLVGGTALGAGAGILGFLVQDKVIFPELAFPTIPVLSIAALLGAGALFFSTTGLGDLTEGAIPGGQ